MNTPLKAITLIAHHGHTNNDQRANDRKLRQQKGKITLLLLQENINHQYQTGHTEQKYLWPGYGIIQHLKSHIFSPLRAWKQLHAVTGY